MNEVARCYLEGIGCKKDKVSTVSSHPIIPSPKKAVQYYTKTNNAYASIYDNICGFVPHRTTQSARLTRSPISRPRCPTCHADKVGHEPLFSFLPTHLVQNTTRITSCYCRLQFSQIGIFPAKSHPSPVIPTCCARG